MHCAPARVRRITPSKTSGSSRARSPWTRRCTKATKKSSFQGAVWCSLIPQCTRRSPASPPAAQCHSGSGIHKIARRLRHLPGHRRFAARRVLAPRRRQPVLGELPRVPDAARRTPLPSLPYGQRCGALPLPRDFGRNLRFEHQEHANLRQSVEQHAVHLRVPRGKGTKTPPERHQHALRRPLRRRSRPAVLEEGQKRATNRSKQQYPSPILTPQTLRPSQFDRIGGGCRFSGPGPPACA